MVGAKKLLEISKSISLLYIEDDVFLRKDTLRLLSTFFDSIEIAFDGKEGLEKYEPQKFDLIISDLVMPRMGGIDFAREVKKVDPMQMLLILSAHDEEKILSELKEIGVNDFLFKPLNINKFIEILYGVCKKIHGQQ